MGARKLEVVFVGDTKSLDRAVKRTKSQVAGLEGTFDRASSKLKSVGTKWSAFATAPIAGMGAAAVKSALDYGKSMTKIGALTSASTQDVKRWSVQVRELSKGLPQSANELAEALYFVASAGVPMDKAMGVLQVSARAAAAGLGRTETVADAVTSAMGAYGHENLAAAEATDVLVAAIHEGKAEADQMAGVFGKINPVAAAMGVEFHEVGAALASMSNLGGSTDEWATRLVRLLSNFQKPAKATHKTLERMGTNIEEVRQRIREDGLLSAMEWLRDLTAKYGEDITDVIPRLRGYQGFLALTGERAADNRVIFDKLRDSTGSLDKAFGKASEGARFRLDSALSTLKANAIATGENLLVVVVPAVEAFAAAMDKVAGLPREVKLVGLAFVALAAAVGPVALAASYVAWSFGKLVGAWKLVSKALKGAILLFRALPVLLLTGGGGAVVAAVLAVGAAALLLYKNWDWVKDKLGKAWAWLKRTAGEVFRAISGAVSDAWDAIKDATGAVWGAIRRFLEPLWRVLKSTAEAAFAAISTVVYVAWQTIKVATKIAWEAIKVAVQLAWVALKAVFRAAFGWAVPYITGAWNAVKDATGAAWDWIKGAVSAAWKWVADRLRGGARLVEKAVVNPFRSAFDWVLDKLKWFHRNVLKGVGRIATGLGDWAKGLKGRIIDTFHSVVNTVIRFVNKILSVIDKIPGVKTGRIDYLPVRQSSTGAGGYSKGKGGHGAPGSGVGPYADHGDRMGGVADVVKAPLKLLQGGAGWLLDQLPGKLPGFLGGLAKWLIDRVTKFVKSKIGGLFGGGSGSMGSEGGGLKAVTALARKMGLVVTSGYRPGDDGWHGRNRARDYAGPPAAMRAFAAAVVSQFGKRALEVIYTPLGFGVKNGSRVGLGFFGPAVNADHFDHVHVAMAQGGLVRARVGELGPEDVYLPTGARVVQASESRGGDGPLIGEVHIHGSTVSEEMVARELAWRLATAR